MKRRLERGNGQGSERDGVGKSLKLYTQTLASGNIGESIRLLKESIAPNVCSSELKKLAASLASPPVLLEGREAVLKTKKMGNGLREKKQRERLGNSLKLYKSALAAGDTRKSLELLKTSIAPSVRPSELRELAANLAFSPFLRRQPRESTNVGIADCTEDDRENDRKVAARCSTDGGTSFFLSELYVLELSPNGEHLACGSLSGKLTMLQTVNGSKIVSANTAHSDCVVAIAWSTEKAFLLSAGRDFQIVLWDVNTLGSNRQNFEPLRTFHLDNVVMTQIVWFPGSASKFALGTNAGVIVYSTEPLAQTTTGAHGLTTVQSWVGSYVHEMAVSSRENCIVALTSRSVVNLIPLNGGNTVSVSIQVGNSPLCSMSQSLCGRYFLFNAIGNMDSHKDLSQFTVYCWNIRTKKVSKQYTAAGRHHGRCKTRSVFGGRNEEYVVAGDEYGYVSVWDRSTGNLLSNYKAHFGPINCLVSGKGFLGGAGNRGLFFYEMFKI
eukprot:g4751.t1